MFSVRLNREKTASISSVLERILERAQDQSISLTYLNYQLYHSLRLLHRLAVVRTLLLDGGEEELGLGVR